MLSFKVEKSKITKNFENCLTAIDKKTTSPILETALIKFEGDLITMISTNLETTVIEKIEAIEKEGEGAFSLPIKYVYEISKISSDEIIIFNFNEDNKILEVKSGNSKYKIPCLDEKDYPETETIKKEGIEINIEEFIRYFNKIKFSISEDSLNKSYSGVLIKNTVENDIKQMEMVTTDIHRISVLLLKKMFIDLPELDEGILVPGKMISDLAKIFSNEKNVKLSIEDGKILFKSQNTSFTSRLIENKFPDYKMVIGNYKQLEEREKSIINKNEMINAIRRVVALTKEEKVWIIKLNFKGNLLTLNSESNFGGNSTDQIMIEKPFEEDKIFAVNAKYLTDVISVLEEKTVSFSFDGGLKPIIIVENKEEYFYTHMLMPLKI